MYKELFGKQKNIEDVQEESKKLALKTPWKYALSYESYMPDLSGEYARDAMRNIFEPAVTSNEEFNIEELTLIESKIEVPQLLCFDK
jgi:hypothetical protein